MKMWEPKRPRLSSESPRFSDTDHDEEKPEGSHFQSQVEVEEGKLVASFSQTPAGENDEIGAFGSRSKADIGINPMLNPVVLDGLLGFCQLEDLRRFRLVCKLWLEVSLKRWRNEMIVIIAKPSSSNKGRLTWDNLDDLYNDPDIKAKPFRRFRLTLYEFPKTEVDKGSSFLETCGPWMHDLEIIEPTIPSVPLFYKFMFEQAPNLKSLKLLEMPDFTVSGERSPKKPHLSLETLSVTLGDDFDEEDDWVPFLTLFRCFPNVKNLILNNPIEEEYENLTKALEEIYGPSPKKGVEVRKLNVICKAMWTSYSSDPVAISHKNFIRLPYISLSNLGVDLHSKALNENFLSDVFRLHQKTLTTLDLSRDRDQEDDVDNIPRNPFQSPQPFLTKLRLSGNVVNNFYFLQDTPNLKLLHFSEIHLRNTLNKTSLRKMESKVRLGNLKMLRILPIATVENHDFTEEEMKMIVTCMPSVKQFVGPLTNDSFRVICESWKELKVLQITHSRNPVNDSGITGIGVPSWEDECRKPNITDLKYLYKFGTANSPLSDDSVWNGFLKLEYLHSLKVKFCENTSNEAFSAAFFKCPSFSVTRASSRCKGKQQLNLDLQTKAAQLFYDFGIK